jgi:RNA polymerase subunit RPABC4/transcription elongation factor Spt4
MERKRLIVKMAVAAIVVFILASSGRIVDFMIKTSKMKKLMDKRNKLVANLGNEYQEYLNKTASEIKQLPVNQLLINQIASEVLKKSPITRLYLWMSNSEGQFVFGVPHPIFERLNKSYDKYRDIIEADGYYVDRNDFLLKLVHQYKHISFSQFESGILAKDGEIHRRLLRGDLPGSYKWRFYRESEYMLDYSQPLRLELSAPVTNDNQQMIGTLYLKISDYTTPVEYTSFSRKNFFNMILFPACEIFFGFSLVFLWFLLPSWVYIDARQRDVKNALRWALFTVVSFGFAWLIYLMVRPSTMQSFYCPQCEKELNGTKAFCPYCGFDLSHVFCPQCQYPVKSDWQFCPSCRTDLFKESKISDETPGEENK